MKKKRKDKFLHNFGIVLMFIGLSILIIGLPITFLPSSIYFEVGPVKASADVPETNAVFITTGAIIFLLGFTIYKKS